MESKYRFNKLHESIKKDAELLIADTLLLLIANKLFTLHTHVCLVPN